MEPALINIDGHIDLIQQAPDPIASDLDRARLSRLNDVMIVFEREKAALEDTLKARLSADVLTNGIDSLVVNLDEQLPKFSIAIRPATEDGAAIHLTSAQRTALAAETSSEITASIEKLAAYAEKPRWKLDVAAVYRQATVDKAKQARMKSVWLRTLFWLLAAVILAVAYLYLKQGAAW